MIRVEMKSEKAVLGERVTGQAVWNSSGSKQPRKIEVICRWRIEGKKKGEDLIDSVTEESLEGRSQAVVPFDFEVPFTAPVTYDGKLFRIVWEIVANVDLPFATDEKDVKVFHVAPAVWTTEEYRQWSAKDFDAEEDEDDEREEEKAE